MKASPMFSFQVNESTDVTSFSQLLVFVTYIHSGDMNISLFRRHEYIFPKRFEPKFWRIGLASRASESWSKIQKHPHFGSSSQENP